MFCKCYRGGKAIIIQFFLSHFVSLSSPMYLISRGAPICKITDIPITDILAMKITDSDTDTDLSVMQFPYLKHKNVYFNLLFKIVNTCNNETDWPMKLLPICQYYRYQCRCCQFQYRYQCQCNIGQCNGFYRCADVKNMADIGRYRYRY